MTGPPEPAHVSPSALRLQRARYALDPPQENARGAWAQRHALELELGAPGEPPGRGEAAPLPDYSSDRLDDCERALQAVGGERLAALADAPARELIDAAAEAVPPEFPAARFALETALLDRAARRSGRPLWQLLSELIPGAEVPGPVALCALLPSAHPDRALELGREHVAAGVRAFKLKIGPERLTRPQLATLDALRQQLGAGVALRLDANRSLDPAELAATLERASHFGVEFLEEPLAEPVPEALAHSPCPLALDESLQGLGWAQLSRLLELSAVQVVVLKPTALGGFGACIRLALAARARGRDAVVSHTLEGPIGWAACAHLALALQGPRAAGLWPLAHQSAPQPRITGARLLLGTEPGLGWDP